MSTLSTRPDGEDHPSPSRWKPELAGAITALAIAAALSIGVFYLSIRDALLDDFQPRIAW